MADGGRSALLVATAQYGDEQLKRLRAPVRDAQALHDVLADPGIGGFDVTLLTDRPSYEVREKIEGFFSDRSPDELLLLYFSCHGVTDTDGRLYFATTDTRRQRFRATAVEAAFVQDCVHGCRSHRIVLVLDCCHSGAFPAGATPKSDLTAPIKAQLEGRGRAVLTSSDALEYAFEVDGDRVEGSGVGSAFTNALVEGLRTGRADLDGDGWISVDELYEYTYRQVREQQPSQTPRAWIDVQGRLLIARNVQPPAADALPAELQELLRSPFANARVAAVKELTVLLAHPRRGIAAAARQALVELSDDDSRSVQLAAQAALVPAPPVPATTAPPTGTDEARSALTGMAQRAADLAPLLIAAAGSLAGLLAFLQPLSSSGYGPTGWDLATANGGTGAQIAAIAFFLALIVGLAFCGYAVVTRRRPRRLAMAIPVAGALGTAALLALALATFGLGDATIAYAIALTGAVVATVAGAQRIVLIF